MCGRERIIAHAGILDISRPRSRDAPTHVIAALVAATHQATPRDRDWPLRDGFPPARE